MIGFSLGCFQKAIYKKSTLLERSAVYIYMYNMYRLYHSMSAISDL